LSDSRVPVSSTRLEYATLIDQQSLGVGAWIMGKLAKHLYFQNRGLFGLPLLR